MKPNKIVEFLFFLREITFLENANTEAILSQMVVILFCDVINESTIISVLPTQNVLLVLLSLPKQLREYEIKVLITYNKLKLKEMFAISVAICNYLLIFSRISVANYLP